MDTTRTQATTLDDTVTRQMPTPGTDRSDRPWKHAGRGTGVTRALWDTGYLLSAFPLALVGFVLAAAGVSIGVATVILWVGLPLLTFTVLACSVLARLERSRLVTLQALPAHRPAFLRADADAGFVRRCLTPLRDPQRWLDVVWSLVGLLTALVGFSVALVWVTAMVAGLTYGAWFWALPAPSGESLSGLVGLGDHVALDIAANFVLGAAAALTWAPVVRAAAWLHATVAHALLNSREALTARVRRAEGARAAAQQAEVASLRRLERDIHDGPQQRLVRLTMDLGRARRMLAQESGEVDRERAGAAVDSALEQARETLDELRALSRGIAPPILVDRGLEAALEELAVRSAVPVRLEVGAGVVPLGASVETAVYFTVSEALTNVAKHSGAADARVFLGVDDEVLVVEVSDTGRGGAHPGKGQGLAGLEQRLAGVGGSLQVTSPEGGPTRLVARVPLGG